MNGNWVIEREGEESKRERKDGVNGNERERG